MLPGIIWIALAGPAGGLVRQEMHGECGAWICSVECIILTVSNTYIDAGGYAHE